MSAQNHPSPQQKGSAGEAAAQQWGSRPCKAPGAGPLPSGRAGAKTGALQFTSHQLLALHLLFLYCSCKASRSLHPRQEEQLLLCTQSSGRGARLVPSSLVIPSEADWSHKNTLSSLLSGQGRGRCEMRSQESELLWSMRLLLLGSTDTKLLTARLNNAGPGSGLEELPPPPPSSYPILGKGSKQQMQKC